MSQNLQKADPKYFKILVESKKDGGEKVNIKIPFKLLRSGIRLATFVPENIRGDVSTALKEKGVDVDFSSDETIEEFLNQIAEITIDVENEKEKIQIFCE